MIKNLVPGSKCVVYVATSNEEVSKNSGTFQGFVPVGEDSSICLELDGNQGELEGTIRLIPTNMIAAIDVIELAKEEKEEKKYEDTHYYS